MSQVKVKFIVIETRDGPVELTLEEAKELHRELDGMFGGMKDYPLTVPIFIDRSPYWDRPYFPIPSITGDSTSPSKEPQQLPAVYKPLGGHGAKLTFVGDEI